MHYRYAHQNQIYEIELERQGSTFRLAAGGQSYTFEVLDEQPGQLSLLFEGRPVTLYWAAGGTGKWISYDGCSYLLEKPAPRGSRSESGEAGDAVRAPMPAQVLSLLVSEGDAVQKGQTLALLEAMKMEIRLKAPREGRVAALPVAEGASVDRGQVVIKLA